MAEDDNLLRMVRPGWWNHNGEITRNVFLPRPADNGPLSVTRETAVMTPERAFHLHVDRKPDGYQIKSDAVAKVFASECRARGLDVAADPVPATESAPANPEHHVIDFNASGAENWPDLANQLAEVAGRRGLAYRR